jgi:hypothetical protein
MKPLFIASLWAAVALPAWAADILTEGTAIMFAKPEEGRAILCRRDDYVTRLSPFDRSSRLKAAADVSEADYLSFVARQPLAWTAPERTRILEAIGRLRGRLKTLEPPLPERVVFIKTTGREEGGAAYTRANAIVLTEEHVRRDTESLARLICHELFHVISRANPAVRDGLYETIGFRRCAEPTLPESLRKRKLTNPDAPVNDHCIDVAVDDWPRTMVPILLSRSERYDVSRGGEFFDYLELWFLAVDIDEATGATTPVIEDGEPVLEPVDRLSGFFEQVGHNTAYIIHPEEILADNFAHLVLETPDLETPAIVAGMRRFFADARAAAGP